MSQVSIRAPRFRKGRLFNEPQEFWPQVFQSAPLAFARGDIARAGPHPAPLGVSIRAPRFRKGRPKTQSLISSALLFQSAPLAFARGDSCILPQSFEAAKFQSAPLAFARGDPRG